MLKINIFMPCAICQTFFEHISFPINYSRTINTSDKWTRRYQLITSAIIEVALHRLYVAGVCWIMIYIPAASLRINSNERILRW
jgi:hypothetical protein